VQIGAGQGRAIAASSIRYVVVLALRQVVTRAAVSHATVQCLPNDSFSCVSWDWCSPTSGRYQAHNPSTDTVMELPELPLRGTPLLLVL
jgi:hypothetical protein